MVTGMSTVPVELEKTLNQLDARSAGALEQLVRDAMALARPPEASATSANSAKGWPAGYFERTAGGRASLSCAELAERWLKLERLEPEEASAFADDMERAHACLPAPKSKWD